MDGPGEHSAKQNKPVREKEASYDFIYMWNLMNKIKLTNKIEADPQIQRSDRQLSEEGELGELGDKDKELSKEKKLNDIPALVINNLHQYSLIWDITAH